MGELTSLATHLLQIRVHKNSVTLIVRLDSTTEVAQNFLRVSVHYARLYYLVCIGQVMVILPMRVLSQNVIRLAVNLVKNSSDVAVRALVSVKHVHNHLL